MSKAIWIPSSIKSTTFSKSASFSPREVRAGVPAQRWRKISVKKVSESLCSSRLHSSFTCEKKLSSRNVWNINCHLFIWIVTEAKQQYLWTCRAWVLLEWVRSYPRDRCSCWRWWRPAPRLFQLEHHLSHEVEGQPRPGDCLFHLRDLEGEESVFVWFMVNFRSGSVHLKG